MESLVYGIGHNDNKFKAYSNKKLVKEYKLWADMLLRCTTKYWDKNPTYVGTNCSASFKSYSFFYEWCQEQVGFGNIGNDNRKWQIDKDLLVKNNTTYSEEVCIFLPQEINSLIINRRFGRGEYPVGVYFDSKWKKYVSRCCAGNGNKIFIGSFFCPVEAFQAYKTFKEAYIKQVAEQYKSQIDLRAYRALIEYEVHITD